MRLLGLMMIASTVAISHSLQLDSALSSHASLMTRFGSTYNMWYQNLSDGKDRIYYIVYYSGARQ